MGSFIVRIKLFYKDRTAFACWCICVAVMIAVLARLNLHAAQMSALPVGLEISGEGILTDRAASSFRENEALYVYEGNFNELYGLLTDGYIYCIVSINPDFDRLITEGKTDGIMTLYSARDDKVATVVGDIAAGCCMDAVCMHRAYNTYTGLKEPEGVKTVTSIEEYSGLLEAMEKTGGYDYDFVIEYFDTGKKTAKEIRSGLIYRQIIAGLMGLLILLSAFCCGTAVSREFENGIRTRVKIGAQPASVTWFWEISALFVCTAPLAFTVLVFAKETTAGNILKMVGINLGLILFSVIMYYILAGILKNVFAYQVLGTIVLIGLGVLGLVSVFEGVVLGNSRFFAKTPVGFYIRLLSRMM